MDRRLRPIQQGSGLQEQGMILDRRDSTNDRDDRYLGTQTELSSENTGFILDGEKLV
jgi:hypothetical protein